MRRRVLGVTGGIGSGKSTVMALLSRAGVPTASADELSHACLQPSHPVYRSVRRRFGQDILYPDGSINRQALGVIIFAKPKERFWLQQQIHPHVRRAVSRFIASHSGFVAIDIPLLFEVRWNSLVDQVVVVYATQSQRIQRLKRRDGLSVSEIKRRMAAQWSLRRKRKKADIVIDNSRDRGALQRAVSTVLAELGEMP